MRDRQDELEAMGAAVAAVGLGDRSYASAFRADTGITFPLLVDERRQAYRAVGLKSAGLGHLLKVDNFRARSRAKSAGHAQHKLGKDPLQLGGSFVFAAGGGDLYAHVSETFGDNAPIEDLLAALGS